MRNTWLRWIDTAGVWLTLVLPLFLLHGRGIADAVGGLIAVLFLLQAAMRRDWAWLRRRWVWVAALWWGWLVLCSARHGQESVFQGAATVRFLLLVAALEDWTLRHAFGRRWLARGLRWAAVYIVAQSLFQFATGHNLFGDPRGSDGELTGPYPHARAGAPLSRLLYPAVLPVVGRWLSRPGAGWVAAGAALLPAAVGVMVLIGQRMPLLLSLMGLFVTALLLPRLRGAVLFASVFALMLVAATPVVSPPAFHRLVTKFSLQMEDFPDSAYGQIAARAVRIAEAQPLMGAGFDGFRHDCADPRYFHGWHGGDGGGAAMCVQHPHNFYLQALVEGGVPGLLLFAALAVAWLAPLFRGLWTTPDPLRVGLFVGCLIHLWPIASTTAFTSMPLGGFFFVLLGLGLAEAHGLHASQTVPSHPSHAI